ncbi:MAG TPA: hypothetical protein VFE88_00385 [Candidatus Nanoarchaeia archaeon]|nr:hypothetical protein [Candidatus Nanoarchaeia archaeon]
MELAVDLLAENLLKSVEKACPTKFSFPIMITPEITASNRTSIT